MPHLVLEYTSNIQQTLDFPLLFASLHEMLVEKTGAEINACKSRAIKQDNFYIGDGDAKHAFVNLDIFLMSGRSLETRKKVGDTASALLREAFQQSFDTLALQITVKVSEIPSELYFKYSQLV